MRIFHGRLVGHDDAVAVRRRGKSSSLETIKRRSDRPWCAIFHREADRNYRARARRRRQMPKRRPAVSHAFLGG